VNPRLIKAIPGLAAVSFLAAIGAIVLGVDGGVGPAVLLMLGIVAALLAVQLPATVIQARRGRRLHAAHNEVVTLAGATADLEHRRLAWDLREQVLPDLAGVGYTLGAAGSGLAGDPELSRRLAEVVQRDIRTLRRILVDVQTPDLSDTAFAAAISDLTAVLRMSGVMCVVRVPELVRVPDRVARLLYRTAREALRNVDRHARAKRIDVAVLVTDTATLTVTDDGVGFEPGPATAAAGGLHLLRTAVTGAGGTLAINGGSGRGTTVAVTLPLRSGG
jgi:two-component system, NarL family, sensor kinase